MDTSVLEHLRRNDVSDVTLHFLKSDLKMCIGGQWCHAMDGATLTAIDPANLGTIAQIPSATSEDTERAIIAAHSALNSAPWSTMLPLEREKLMHRLADLIDRDADIIAEIEALDAGKAISGCRDVDIAGSIDVLRYFAGWPSKIQGATRTPSVPGEHLAMTTVQPGGVVAAIVPWNWPLNMLVWKFAAAIAAGCTLVVKPAQQTSLSAIYFARLVEAAGFPPGVFNLLTGKGSSIGNLLVSHPLIDKVSFTGSTPVGQEVGGLASQNLAHVTLELGGKSPMLVFNDADIGQVVAATQQSIFFNSGQVCSAGSRLYVQREIYQDVIKAVSDKANSMRVGESLHSETEMGPVISEAQYRSVMNYIQSGIEQGAQLVCGGKGDSKQGYYVSPTVFADCTHDMRIVNEEIFGPVLCIQPFDTEEQGVKLANDNIYGLAASVFSQNASLAHRVARRINAGTVWINTHDLVDPCLPFGGFKQSGLGKDLGPEQLQQYLQSKTIWQVL